MLVGAACGNFGAPFTGSYLTDFLLVAFFAIIAFGIPFYGIALIVLLIFARSVLERPFLWSVLGPAVLLMVSLWAFPIWEIGGIMWLALIPLCATLAGIAFYAWLRVSPLAAPARR